jgi:hypothetical protein
VQAFSFGSDASLLTRIYPMLRLSWIGRILRSGEPRPGQLICCPWRVPVAKRLATAARGTYRRGCHRRICPCSIAVLCGA